MAPIEYGFYLVLFYTVLGPPLGLILMGQIGTGFVMIPVLAFCAVVLGPSFLTVLRTAWIPIACGASHLFIQLVVHEESMYASYVYQFGPWLMSLVVVQALCMYRPHFLHRCAWFILFMGLALVPFMAVGTGEGYERIKIDRAAGLAFSNPNALAAWFGFCAVYLTFRGYVETRQSYRLIAWFMAICSLYVVSMTVSRGALIAVAASLLVAGRRMMKAGLLPALLLIVILLGLLEVGVFDRAIYSYSRRAGEETGRLLIWPLLLDKFMDSPLVGIGVTNAGAVSPKSGLFVTPHNSFLLFAVASGIVPFLLFCLYCGRSAVAALRANPDDQDSMYYLPLVLYTVLTTSAGNMDFMAPWAVLSLAVPVAAHVSRMVPSVVSEVRLSELRPEEVR